MDINGVGVVILCISGIWSLQGVFGESDSMANMFNDIRIELDSLKLSTERNKREIIRLKNQVSECNTENADLSEKITAFVYFEKRLRYIEHEMETLNKKLLKGDDSVAMSGNIDGLQTGAYGVNGDGEANVLRSENGLKADFDGVGDELHQDVDDMNDDNRRGKSSSSGKRNQIDKRIVPVTSVPTINTKIAFSANLNQFMIGIRSMQIVPFNNFTTNEGLAFSTVSHTFTCPVSGIYYFTSSITANFKQTAAAVIMKNGVSLAEMYSEGDTDHDQNGYDQGSNSIVTVCNKGDRVWVQAGKRNDMSVLGDYFTTFSGFIISAL